jgi:hypothetical protein
MPIPMIASAPAADVTPYRDLASTGGTIDPETQAKIDEMNMIIAMQQQQMLRNRVQAQTAATSSLSSSDIGSTLGALYKGGQQAGIIPAPRAQLVKLPTTA